MIEKGGRDAHEDTAGWSEKRLNERIMALYEQIERATLQNLEVARKNSELQIQIQTIDQVIRNHPHRLQPQRPPSPLLHKEEQYGTLLSEHLALAERVARIEELLATGEKRGFLGRDNQNTLQRITSIQDLARGKKGIEKERAKAEGENTKREDTVRKSKYA